MEDVFVPEIEEEDGDDPAGVSAEVRRLSFGAAGRHWNYGRAASSSTDRQNRAARVRRTVGEGSGKEEDLLFPMNIDWPPQRRDSPAGGGGGGGERLIKDLKRKANSLSRGVGRGYRNKLDWLDWAPQARGGCPRRWCAHCLCPGGRAPWWSGLVPLFTKVLGEVGPNCDLIAVALARA